MNKILSRVRRCVEDYDMIQAGDTIGVGLSGGKDSFTLLVCLAALRQFYPQPFTLEAFTVDISNGQTDFGPAAELCAQLQVPYTIVPTDITRIIFEVRQEKNPCSMCAKMRRGALHEALNRRGISKVALGHHYDDAVETFFLSLFYEGRISCFQPVSYLDRTDITQIRPLLYCGESMIRDAAARHCLPIIHNPCPANGHTKRQEIKELIAELSQRYPRLKDYVFGGMQRLPLPQWAPKEFRRRPLPEEE